MSSFKGSTTIPLIGDSIAGHLRSVARMHPSREFLVSAGSRMSYQRFDEYTSRIAHGMHSRGVAKGDRVGIWMGNRAEWLGAFFGCQKLGAIAVNVNPAYKADELRYAMELVGAKMLFYKPTSSHSRFDEILREMNDPSITCIHVGDENPSYQESVSFESLMGDDSSFDVNYELVAADAANIQFTSGTTGRPKGATLSGHSILNNGFFVGERMRLERSDKIVIPVPLYHCFGLVIGVLAGLTHSSSVLFPSEYFDARATLDTVVAEEATVLHGVPTMFISMLSEIKQRNYDKIHSLRTGVMAGSNCPPETMKEVQSVLGMDQVTICYGMTETSPVSCQTFCDEESLQVRTETVGSVHPHVQIRIVDREDRNTVVPVGLAGEFHARGYLTMMGYWNNKAKTGEALVDGWMRSEDLAVADAHGNVKIVGRMKDMIIRGGENIYPAEIEAFLLAMDQVADVQVVGVPDGKYGEEICAVFKMEDAREEISSESVKKFCVGRLSHFKIPRHVLRLQVGEDYPMTVTGKVRKDKLRTWATSCLEGEL